MAYNSLLNDIRYNFRFVTNNGFQSSAFRSNRGGPGVFYRQHNNNYNNNKQNAQQHYNSKSAYNFI